MKLSAKGAGFIGRFEGFRAEPYNDPAGHATVGYGHLLHFGPVTNLDKRQWGGMSREKGLKLLREDARDAGEAVDRLITRTLTQAQYDALVSLVFNIGAGNFQSSTLRKLLNQGAKRQANETPHDAMERHFQEVRNAWFMWNKAGTPLVIMPGLVSRRKAEYKLYKTGLYRDGNAPAQRPPVRLPYQRGPSPSFTWQEVHRGRKPFTAADRARAIVQARSMEKVRVRVNARRAAHNLKPTGINVLSWHRPLWYNEQVGGASKSQHIGARACDISKEEIRRLMPWEGGAAEFDRIMNEVFAEGGFGQYPAGSRHGDTRGYKARWNSW